MLLLLLASSNFLLSLTYNSFPLCSSESTLLTGKELPGANAKKQEDLFRFAALRHFTDYCTIQIKEKADADVDGACWPQSSSPTFVTVVRQAVAPLSSVIVVVQSHFPP